MIRRDGMYPCPPEQIVTGFNPKPIKRKVNFSNEAGSWQRIEYENGTELTILLRKA